MRIAMVTDGAHAGRECADLAAALVGLGHEVDTHDVASDSVRGQNDLLERFVELWRATAPAVVHCRSRFASGAAVDAARAAAIPVVYSPRPTEGAPNGTTARDIAVRADRVIASCTAELTELVAGKVPRQRISVVPYGVDTEHFAPHGAHPPTDGAHRLVAVGDLAPGTGFATAVGALRGLPDTELILAGAPEHGNHAKELREYARRLGVSARLHIDGPVDRATLPSLLRSAHVVLCTPWRPRFGTAALEATACGVAVVANNTGGLTDTVVDGVTGLLVAPHQPRALATAVWTLLSHPALRQQYGAAGWDRARARYSWRQIALETLETYSRAGAIDEAAPDTGSLRRR
jgi:glycosyltransferase involved in cell wall biosynthesis